ncbi:MAG: DUF3726 domain-containing protein [Woeseiaceae bacterium]
MNELSSLLKRSFEGSGYCQGDYEDAAAAVVWLEAHGMKGLEAMVPTWSRSTDAETGLEHIADTSGAKVLDAQDGNVVFCGRMLVDLACARAATGGSGRIELRRCHGRMAILASLGMCATRGLHGIAHWSDKDNMHIASIHAGQPRPDYRRLQRRPQDRSRSGTLLVVCSRGRETIKAIAEELAGSGKENVETTEVSSSDMQVRYDTAVRHGLRVDPALIRTLTAAADSVLVEASERSRLGAGESQS